MSFFDLDEGQRVDQFLQTGYLIFDVEDRQALHNLCGQVVKLAGEFLQTKVDVTRLFQGTQGLVKIDQLNAFRMHIIQGLRDFEHIGPMIYKLAKNHLNTLIGNELAMQRGPNLSIQYPGDKSSLLALHSDVWSGNSPYELVLWIPLVDCYASKSMYLVPLEKTRHILQNFSQFTGEDAESFYQNVEPYCQFIKIKKGQAMLFWHGLIHGNRINVEPQPRWSLNIRFKSYLTPYGSKELGETFLPITIRPATRLGFAYKEPKC